MSTREQSRIRIPLSPKLVSTTLGIVIGVGGNLISNAVTWPIFAYMASAAAALLAAQYIRRRPSGAPVKQFALRFFVIAAMMVCVFACIAPDAWRGWVTIATALVTLTACLIASDAHKALNMLLGIAFLALGVCLLGQALNLASPAQVYWLTFCAVMVAGLGMAYIYGNEKFGHCTVLLLTISAALYLAVVQKYPQNPGLPLVLAACGFTYYQHRFGKDPLVTITPMALSLTSVVLTTATLPATSLASFAALAGMALTCGLFSLYFKKSKRIYGTLALLGYGSSIIVFGSVMIANSSPADGAAFIAGGAAMIGYCIVREMPGIAAGRIKLAYFLNGPEAQSADSPERP